MGNYILGVPVGQTSTRMSMVDRPSGFAGFRWRFIPFGTAALPFQSLTLIIDAHYQLICLQECRMCPVIPALLKIVIPGIQGACKKQPETCLLHVEDFQ
ncbi:hypothetical protein GWP43_07380 [Treponema vincentii]|uniref:Uncharacterized protein n=1 Tax=Treponema vincentii TaxID=69710 RepID=A0A6P1Y0K1_9SPIR|nr:hypothetical protein [Treponema vincentii]QHX43298.1 hypothetical protein GWP43_07380 [Treponema vincentii]